MFKKIEIWVLYLFIVFSVLFALFFGVLVNIELNKNPFKRGWWSETALYLVEIPFTIRIAIKGLTVEDRFPNQSGFEGVPNSAESYLLLSKYDGDLKEGIVEIVDLTNFDVLHTWNPDIDQLNSMVDQVDEFKDLDRDNNNSRALLRHPKLTEDGGLLFGTEHRSPIYKIDECSNLVFQVPNNVYHHSIETDIDGNIWAPSRLYPYSLPVIKVGADISSKFMDDAIVKLSPDGKILFEKSVSQILIENDLEHLVFGGQSPEFYNDPVHLNDIQPVDFDSDYWKKGDVFLSLLTPSLVILYRPSTNVVVWKGTGHYVHQHDVDILDNERISIFNNNAKNLVAGMQVDGHNEIIIYDFATDRYSSYLSDSLTKTEVRTITEGRSQILPNNDVFIEETNYGRILYFNGDGSLRWTHVNRASNDKVYHGSWSRVLYKKEDLLAVKNLLLSKGTCDD